MKFNLTANFQAHSIPVPGTGTHVFHYLSILSWCMLKYSIYDTSTSTKELIRKMVNSVGDPDPHVFGPPGSGFISQRYRSGYRSFHFLIKALSGLKLCLQNKILTQNFSKKIKFLRLKIMNVPARSYKREI
jgi:hypothetical protein